MRGSDEGSRDPSCGGSSGIRLLALLLATVLGAALSGPARAAQGSGAEQAAAPEEDETARRLRELEELVTGLQAEIERLRRGGGDSPSIEELERRIEALSRDLERLRIGPAAMAKAERSMHGFGPAASKVYAVERGVAIGGYGEMLYEDFDDTKDDGTPSGSGNLPKPDRIDLLRAVVYFGYKFDDRWLFNSEIEFEHAVAGDSEEGEVAVEFAYVDFKATENFGARGGLLLIPTGFLNELHEPPIFFGSRRPDVESFIIPSTWRENGAGVYGDLGPVTYRAYIVAGLDATGFDPADGIRGGRQAGSKSKAEDFALTARVDYVPVPGIVVGTSAFSGGVGQGTPGLEEASITQWEAHGEWNWRGIHLRGLYAKNIVTDTVAIGNAIDMTNPPVIGERQVGWYGEVAWDALSMAEGSEQELSPFFRYESFDTQQQVAPGSTADPTNDRQVRTFGLHYQPIPNLAIKADVQDHANGLGTAIDQLNLALGYLF